MMTADERRQRAKLAANSRWARPFAREEQAEASRAAMERRFRKQVDPDGVLSDAELAPLLAAARRAYSARMNFARAKKESAA